MRFLIDPNLPRAAMLACQKFGHQVEFARDIGLAAASDEQVAARANQSGADFSLGTWISLMCGDTHRISTPALLFLRLPDTAVALEIVRVLERFLMEPEFLDSLSGRLAIVEVDRVRFRPPIEPRGNAQ